MIEKLRDKRQDKGRQKRKTIEEGKMDLKGERKDLIGNEGEQKKREEERNKR